MQKDVPNRRSGNGECLSTEGAVLVAGHGYEATGPASPFDFACIEDSGWFIEVAEDAAG